MLLLLCDAHDGADFTAVSGLGEVPSKGQLGTVRDS